MTASTVTTFPNFQLPAELEAARPPEERGLTRDAVRLLVARRAGLAIEHRRFADLPALLERGDVLVVNTSATLPAAVDGRLDDGTPAELHLSGRLPAGIWVVELRHPPARAAGSGMIAGGAASTPWLDATAGTVVRLPGRGRVELLAPLGGQAATPLSAAQARLWVAGLDLGAPLLAYLARHGRPIRYGYVRSDRPIAAYQTVFADEPGSAEMPSAARPFSAELVTRLVARGIGVVPFVLHTGVSSPEAHEPPMPEFYRLSAESAAAVNAARQRGNRVVAVGTTAVRTLETVADRDGVVHPGEGWTETVITPERGVRAVDGLVTGWHEPQASHLDLLEAVAGRPLLEASYTAALAGRYLWHEFGDSHLILR